MTQIQLISLTIFAGIFSQIIANRLRLPAIVPLLIIGVALGKLKILQPHLLGDGLHTIVQLGVAIILFEGGLSLKVKQFKEGPRIIRNLVSIGVLITWILSALAAWFFIPELRDTTGFKIALLFGALITVSGPTVITPILKIVKPKRKVASILKWEGILVDPIGALLAVVLLTFFNTSASGYNSILKAFLSSMSIGLAFGAISAFMIYHLLKKTDLITEELRNLMVLTMVLVVYSLSNWVQHETGILSVTVSGFILGILRPRGLREIESFKGQLTTLMVSILFILLAAKLDLIAIWNLKLPGLIVLLIVLFIIRPLNVFVSGINSSLNLNEKVFISWIAPRGIVAAAVASLFSETLRKIPEFADQAGYIESLIFLIIAGTVFFQGPTARFLGKLLNVIEPDPNGVVMIGANKPARLIAKTLMKLNIDVFIIDSNNQLTNSAQKEKIPTKTANAIAQETIEDFELAGFGKLLAITPSETVNALACQMWSHELGKTNVFRVGAHDQNNQPSNKNQLTGDGQLVFHENITQDWLQDNLGKKWEITYREVQSKEEIKEIYQARDHEEIYLLGFIHKNKLKFCMEGKDLSAGNKLIYLKKRA